MTHPPYIRAKARQLRAVRGLTIDEIAERLALPRATVYRWVRDLPIERTARQSAAQRRGTQAMRAKAAGRRAEAYRQGIAEFATLRREPTFEHFVCLYLAEGSKRNRNALALGNSDPAIVVLADRWLGRLSDKPRTYEIQYHADQDLDELRRAWGSRLRIDPAAIRLQRKSNSGQLSGRSWRSEYGVLTVRVCDTLLRARLQAWIDLLRADWV
jgi:AcrR family transcriptional regulator